MTTFVNAKLAMDQVAAIIESKEEDATYWVGLCKGETVIADLNTFDDIGGVAVCIVEFEIGDYPTKTVVDYKLAGSGEV